MDRVLKEVRKITNLVDVCHVGEITRRAGAMQFCVLNDTSAMSPLLFFWEIHSQSQKPHTQLRDVFKRYEKSTLSLKVVSNDKMCKYG